MQLNEHFCTVPVNTVNHLFERRNMIIVADGKLRKRRSAAEIIDTGDFGHNQAAPADCALFIIIHHFLGGCAVHLSKSEHHRRHNDSVFEFHIPDFAGGEQFFVLHLLFSFMFLAGQAGL